MLEDLLVEYLKLLIFMYDIKHQQLQNYHVFYSQTCELNFYIFNYFQNFKNFRRPITGSNFHLDNFF
jgi:hypothetical protein